VPVVFILHKKAFNPTKKSALLGIFIKKINSKCVVKKGLKQITFLWKRFV
jgi:hypothetical protein